ncbi:GGDEF domain-containing protein [Lacticaseibacillus zhaodongensis]|uniref:GGDEF domain-containing protein n=1 Tax=Lacticaseibacillus zhaodongensis TaxID=2668065 RepID=UPI0012D352BC|nr:GGDEF domain-containing protein [Lacticaseibacillus zhaodongensis]
MSTGWISLSFGLSLITNVVVFLGVLSLFYWVRGNVSNRFVHKHALGLQLTICFAFEAYLFIESVTNVRLGPNAFGLHWSFLNLLIMAYFVFSIVLQSKWEFLIGMGATILYVLSRSNQITAGVVLGIVVIVLLQYLLTRYGAFLLHHPIPASLALMIFAAASITAIYLLDPVPPHGWFWLRQIAGFLILAIAAGLYAKALSRRNDDMNKYHSEALTDSLTGIKNMGSFNSDLMHLYAQFEQTGARYRLFELDLDHFKQINDTYGHPVGNVVLKQVAATLQQIALEQGCDTKVYRMGGEEFGIILQTAAADPHRAHTIGKEINQRIGALEFTSPKGNFHTTVSLGVEVVLPEDNNYLDIYSKADHYLYQSKHSGRNAITYDGKTYSFS